MPRIYLFFPLMFSILFATGCAHVVETSAPAESNANTNTVKTQNADASSEEKVNYTFDTPKKSAHYESATPEHGAVLPGVPTNVVIDFNFDLAEDSEISITNGGIEYATGETTIDSNLLAMRRTISSDAPDGLYTVSYSACWPDRTCHDGMFQFAIDRSTAENYKDFRDQSALTIDMANITFSPQQVRIAAGTAVTWVNKDAVTHYVNTDSHPAHTYYPDQNSSKLEQGDEYRVVFSTPGVYLYHCSAHADTMKAIILVE